MMSYLNLTIYQRLLLMTILFVISCLSIVEFFIILSRKRKEPKILLPICMIVSGVLTTIFATETRAEKFSRTTSKIVHKFCEIPIIIVNFILILILFYIIFVFVRELHERRNKISRASIKESLDKLPTGLCFYRENGRIILLNNSINELCHKIVGRDLQNAKLFWEILSKGDVLPEIERLESGEYPSFRLKDGNVWSFSRTEIDDVIQIIGSNTTELSNINAELKLKNTELSNINERLREYGEKVDELTRTKERIDIKANIHRELGQALLITKKYIIDSANETEIPLEIWKKNVAMLTREAELSNEETSLSEFLETAEASGVKVEINGKFPKDKNQSNLFILASIECLINSVRHANATTLFITLIETEAEVTAIFENDGDLPNGEIIEGGGLSSLHHKTKRLGGKMNIKSQPRFSLTIILPKINTEGDKK